jgi:hypothetical protein
MSSEQREQKSKQEDQSLNKYDSSSRIEIQKSIQVIHFDDFRRLSSLTEVEFESNSCLRVIDGFQKCTSLRRISIPASVEIIGWNGFYDCTSLSEVTFASDSHLREIHFSLSDFNSSLR